jgi:hypothetical protein
MQATCKLPKSSQRVVPAAMLEAISNRLMTIVLQASMKPYVEGLEQDYLNWAHGRKRTVGKLRPSDKDAALLVTSEPPTNGVGVRPLPGAAAES